MARQSRIHVATRGAGLYEVTAEVAAQLAEAAPEGPALLTVFLRHTSASLIIQENADLDVRRDLEAFFARLVPPADSPTMHFLRHRAEGPDDMPAHIKAALTATSLSIPVADGRMVLGTWQGIYLWEHRRTAHRREIVIHVS